MFCDSGHDLIGSDFTAKRGLDDDGRCFLFLLTCGRLLLSGRFDLLTAGSLFRGGRRLSLLTTGALLLGFGRRLSLRIID